MTSFPYKNYGIISKLTSESIGDSFALIQNAIEGLKMRGIDQWDDKYPAFENIEHDIISGHAFGYFTCGTITGYMGLDNEYPPEYDNVKWKYHGQALVVHRLCIKTENQSQGIGSEMMLFAQKYAKDNSYDVIRLDAFSRNPASLRLYEKLGFLRAGSVEFRKGTFYCYEKKCMFE